MKARTDGKKSPSVFCLFWDLNLRPHGKLMSELYGKGPMELVYLVCACLFADYPCSTKPYCISSCRHLLMKMFLFFARIANQGCLRNGRLLEETTTSHGVRKIRAEEVPKIHGSCS
uniref:Uncharacterized protein n=1 Tax=Solanum tuberosum TaxID=4113 RepID=M1BZH2_SOLTU